MNRDWRDPATFPDPDGRARKIESFIETNLELWEGIKEGQPLVLHPFQRSIIRAIYGPSDSRGERLVRTACIWMPRGCGKTCLSAGLSLAHLVGPESRRGGQVVLAASDRNQASIAFRHAANFVRRSTGMERRLKTLTSRKRIEWPSTQSSLEAVSADGFRQQGRACTFVLADEVHAWPAAGREMWEALVESTKKRAGESPLVVVISTAGEGDGGLARDLWLRSQQAAADPKSDPTFCSVIFAAPEEADWRDEEAWRQCNPGLEAGMVSIAGMRDAAKSAEISPAMLRSFRRYNLNQWQVASAAESWIEPRVYDASAGPRKSLDDLEGEDCWVGVDLGAVDDTTAVAVVFREPVPTGRGYIFHLHCHHFLPADWLHRKGDQDRSDYLAAQADGVLTAVPGTTIDYGVVGDWIGSLQARYKVRAVAVDPWRADLLLPALEEHGVPALLHGQGITKMARPTLAARNALVQGTLRHGGQRLLRAQFLNAAAYTDGAGNQKLVKDKSTGKIDGAIAAIMAVGQASEAEGADMEAVMDSWLEMQHEMQVEGKRI